MTSATDVAVNSLAPNNKHLTILSRELHASKQVGFKELIPHFVTDPGGGAAVTVKQDLHKQGPLVDSNNKMHMGINGEGLFVVSDEGGKVSYTRNGSFDKNLKGELHNTDGYKLLGVKSNENGNGVVNVQDVNNLEPIDLSGVGFSSPEKTKSIAVSELQLNSQSGILQASDIRMHLKNHPQDEFIISYSENPNINIGDQIILKTDSGPEIVLEYGGVANSYSVSERFKVLDVSDINSPFDSKYLDKTLKITLVGGTSQSYEFIVGNLNSVEDNRFNSIKTLADKINAVHDLTAVIRNNILYIAAEDPNLEVKFQGDIKNDLGLSDIPASTNRFNSFKSLEKLVDKLPDSSTGTKLNAGNLIISPNSAEMSLSLLGNSIENNKIFSARIGNGTDLGRATVRIDTNTHGLQIGDVVNISGMNINNIPDGKYFVTNVDPMGFEISVISNDPKALGGTTTATGFPITTQNLSNLNAVWNRVQSDRGLLEPDFSISEIDTDITDATNQVMKIHKIGHGLTDGDIIYLKDFGVRKIAESGASSPTTHDVSIPDAYYKITRIDNDNFSISYSTEIINSSVINSGDFSYKKIGNTTAGIENITLSSSVVATVITRDKDEILRYFGIEGNNMVTAAYDVTDPNSNLSSNKFPQSSILSSNVTLFDSLGNEFQLNFKFAKLATNRWAVEIFDVREKGDLQYLDSGILNFNSDGKLDLSSVKKFNSPISINHHNGDSNIQEVGIDFLSKSQIQQVNLGDEKFLGNVQLKAGGRKYGNIDDIIISEGTLYGMFDNGDTRMLFDIPIATFDDINALNTVEGNSYTRTPDAGKIKIRFKGNNIGTIKSGKLEQSNVDTNKFIIELQKGSIWQQIALRVLSELMKNDKSLPQILFG
ncbi:flagellar basal body FlgE domain-containing protein [Rickettsia endosymbiont of Cardiosporidium cionae]|uniref:flagellar basal body FlgE domain-containing protein n=1 Tax=Rickettsia endosymbiont of Cardiosporidium cionae TaxID=2777155 RepID=UPI0018950002|nr:flagellar basal body FlgE domain-containing protein [Rickettsia endosymbiont of Cardiosporidium cionae]